MAACLQGEGLSVVTGTSKNGGDRAQIGASLLACDLANIASEAERVISCGADFLHIDVMDGHFVPNLTWGPCVIASLRKHTTAFLDVHLMVSHPDRWVEPMAEAGVDGFTFHLESTQRPLELIRQIRDAPRRMRVGVALMPRTPPEVIAELAPHVDMILVMTVEAGFGGQPFLTAMLPKIAKLRGMYPALDIQVDGGLNSTTVRSAAAAGANVIVAGSAIFQSPTPSAVIETLRANVNQGWDGRPRSPSVSRQMDPCYRRSESFSNEAAIRKMIYEDFSHVQRRLSTTSLAGSNSSRSLPTTPSMSTLDSPPVTADVPVAADADADYNRASSV